MAMADENAKTINRKLCPGSQVGADSCDGAEVPRGLKSRCLELLRDEERGDRKERGRKQGKEIEKEEEGRRGMKRRE